MAISNRYIIYRTVASEGEATGYVINAIVWDGSGSTPIIPPGTAIKEDSNQAYRIGSIYTATTS